MCLSGSQKTRLAPTQVVADVDIEEETVVKIEKPEKLTADKAQDIDLDAPSFKSADSESEFELEFEKDDDTDEDNDDEVIEISSNEVEVTNLNESDYTLVEEGEVGS